MSRREQLSEIPTVNGPTIEGGKDIWRIAVMDGIDPVLRDQYLRTFYRFAGGFNSFRYTMMSLKPFVCYEAVGIWSKLQPAYTPLEFGMGIVHFDREVVDKYEFPETGQFVLTIRIPGEKEVLAVDVAGYMFGFNYQEITVGIGNQGFLSEVFTRKYREKYPNLGCEFSTT